MTDRPVELYDAVDAIQHFMDKNGLRRSDIFSSKSRASEVMNRKRPLTLSMIQKLHFIYGLPAEVLISPYREVSE